MVRGDNYVAVGKWYRALSFSTELFLGLVDFDKIFYTSTVDLHFNF